MAELVGFKPAWRRAPCEHAQHARVRTRRRGSWRSPVPMSARTLSVVWSRTSRGRRQVIDSNPRRWSPSIDGLETDEPQSCPGLKGLSIGLISARGLKLHPPGPPPRKRGVGNVSRGTRRGRLGEGRARARARVRRTASRSSRTSSLRTRRTRRSSALSMRSRCASASPRSLCAAPSTSTTSPLAGQ